MGKKNSNPKPVNLQKSVKPQEQPSFNDLQNYSASSGHLNNRKRFRILTNNQNLGTFATRGFIVSVRYFQDSFYSSWNFQAWCPNFIPLLTTETSLNLMLWNPPGTPPDEEPSEYPIMVELSVDLADDCFCLNRQFDIGSFNQEQPDDVFLVALPAIIPFCYVERLYFRDERERRTFNAQRTPEMPLLEEMCAVAPELFRGEVIDFEKLCPMLIELSKRIQPLAGVADLATQDKWSGAMLMLSAYTEYNKDFDFSWLEQSLPSLQLEGISDTLLTTTIQARDNASAILSDERNIFNAIRELLIGSLVSFNDQDLIDQVGNKLTGLELHFLADYQKLLENLSQIFALRAEITSFPSDSPTFSAFLEFMRWHGNVEKAIPGQKFELDPATGALTAIFLGTLYGRARTPLSCRPLSADLINYFDDQMAIACNGQTIIPAKQLSDWQTTSTEMTALKDGKQILVLTKRPPIQDKRQTGTHQAATISSEYPLDPVSLLLKSSLESDTERNAAIYLCLNMGWQECLKIQAIYPEPVIEPGKQIKKSKTREGWIVPLRVDYSIHEDVFRSKLSKNRDSIPDDLMQWLKKGLNQTISNDYRDSNL